MVHIFNLILLGLSLSLLVFVIYCFYRVGAYELFFPQEEIGIANNIKDAVFESDGIKVHYRSIGDLSGQPLIFIHGWGGSYDTRDNILSAFATYSVNAIVLELPGLDRSSTPQTAWTDYDYAKFVHKFVIEQELEKPIIVGQSFGGGIASAYAEKYPKDISTLVLVDANTSDKTTSYISAIKLMGNTFTQLLVSSLIPSGIKNRLIAVMLTVPKDSLGNSSYDERKVMAGTFILTHAENKLQRLQKIGTPTILIWGAWDRKIPVALAKEMDITLKDSKLLLVEGGGHGVIYKKPKTVVDLMMKELGN